jgi:hypothetical protein
MLHNSDLKVVKAPGALSGRRGDVAGVRVDDLADQDLRLLPLAVGDHALPIESASASLPRIGERST